MGIRWEILISPLLITSIKSISSITINNYLAKLEGLETISLRMSLASSFPDCVTSGRNTAAFDYAMGDSPSLFGCHYPGEELDYFRLIIR